MPPPDQVAAVRDLAETLSLGFTDAQVAHLARYLDLLQRWNATYNLTAVRDPTEMLTLHLADCLAAVPAVRRWRREHPEAKRILDVGSGGGLPGVLWAIAETDMEVTCIDTVGKKAAFVQQVALELGLRNLSSVHGRVESIGPAAFEMVTSRAFASLLDFVRLSGACLREGGVWLAMKGKRPDDEIATLPADIDVFHVEPVVVPGLTADRCLVWMRRRSGPTH